MLKIFCFVLQVVKQIGWYIFLRRIRIRFVLEVESIHSKTGPDLQHSLYGENENGK
jgi:hypothetical protein